MTNNEYESSMPLKTNLNNIVFEPKPIKHNLSIKIKLQPDVPVYLTELNSTSPML